MTLLEPWIADRHHAQAWWRAVSTRPSYIGARVGPSGEEAAGMGVEGAKVVDDFRRKRAEYAARYGTG